MAKRSEEPVDATSIGGDEELTIENNKKGHGDNKEGGNTNQTNGEQTSGDNDDYGARSPDSCHLNQFSKGLLVGLIRAASEQNESHPVEHRVFPDEANYRFQGDLRRLLEGVAVGPGAE